MNYSSITNVALQLNNSGHKKYLKVEFEEAIEDFSKAIEINPMLSIAFYNRGTVLYRLGDYKGALEDMQRAVALDSENQEFLKGLEDCRKHAPEESEYK